MENQVAAAIVLVLQEWSNEILAAFNNAVQSFGKVPESNIAYCQAVHDSLIDADGNPLEIDALRDACALEVNRRVQAETFN